MGRFNSLIFRFSLKGKGENGGKQDISMGQRCEGILDWDF